MAVAVKKATPVKKAAPKPATPTKAGQAAGRAAGAAVSPKQPAGSQAYTLPGGDQGMMTAYGWASILADIPQIKAVMDRAVADGKKGKTWTQEAINAALQPYLQTHRQAQVDWELKKHLHPADANSDLSNTAQTLIDKAVELGFSISPDRAKQLADHMLAGGLTKDEADRALLAEFHFDPTQAKGKTAAELSTLRRKAKDYMIPMSDQALSSWVEGITKGTSSEDTFDEYLRNQAKGMFPSMAGMIDAGHSPVDLFSPYTSIAETELGVPAKSIDMSDPKWSGALMQLDPKTGVRTMPNLDEWRTILRTDPRYGWAKTTNAQNMAATFSESLLETFGAVSH